MADPFLKWPGGKRWAAPLIATIVNRHLRGTYYEPFLGGGAVFFQVKPARAVLSDINEELISLYLAVQRNPVGVIQRLKGIPVTKSHYLRVRSVRPRGVLNQAARMLYLNRTAFAGIYRVNRLGQFNVPYGGGQRNAKLLWESSILSDAKAALTTAELLHSDFEKVMDAAGTGDVVYCDPTYTVTHDANCFVRYNERNFSWSDQQRLAAAAAKAARRGATVIVSNAHHQSVIALYPNASVRCLERMSLVSRDPCKRRAVREYLFVLTKAGVTDTVSVVPVRKATDRPVSGEGTLRR
jgi:DNA adenine methylase